MRWSYLTSAIVLAMTYTAFAQQDTGKGENWQKMYQDATHQLRAAQDRRAILAAQNAKLTARVAELEKEAVTLKRDEAGSLAEQTYFLHSFYSGWMAFIRRSPWILDQWNAYFGQSMPGLPDDRPVLFDSRWPFGSE